ncbi:MAG: efflux RND transporter periplasmic adaptor subunit [Bacteroidota bacterium]
MKRILLLIIVIIASSCNKKENSNQSSLEDLYQQKNILNKQLDSISNEIAIIDEQIATLDSTSSLQLVSAFKVEPTTFNQFVEIQGNSASDQNIDIHPEVSGTVVKIFINDGQLAKKGQLLVQIDDDLLENNIQELQTQLTLATTTYERQKRLWDQKIGSEIQFLQAKNNKEGLENKLNTLKTQLHKFKIYAPFSGVIDDVIAKEGSLATPQIPLLRLMNLQNMYVEAKVSENYLKDIKSGNEVTLFFPSIGEEIKAKVSHIGNYINPDNRSFIVKIPVKNTNRMIKPNLLADIKIKTDQTENAVVIPSRLIQIDQNGDEFIFTLNKGNNNYKAKKTMIKSGNSNNNETMIIEGLSLGDIIVNEGSRSINNDQKVEVIFN